MIAIVTYETAFKKATGKKTISNGFAGRDQHPVAAATTHEYLVQESGTQSALYHAGLSLLYARRTDQTRHFSSLLCTQTLNGPRVASVLAAKKLIRVAQQHIPYLITISSSE